LMPLPWFDMIARIDLFRRCNWDIEELKEKKEKITADPAYLNVGVNGWPFTA